MKALAITMIIVSIILCVAILALTIPFIKKALDDTKTTSKVLKIVFGVLMSLFAIDVVVNAFMQTVLTPFMLGFEVYALTVVFPTWKVFVKKGKE